jgi:hypothetical protein
MRRLWGWLTESWARRRTRREFTRLRGELSDLERLVGEQPWWGELPPDNVREASRRRRR